MSDNIIHVADSSFEQVVLKADKPVIVDFWAEWCGPCKVIAPILDELANEYKDKIIVAKLDIDKNQGIPMKYGVRGIPTLIVFNNGDVVATKIGAASKSQLEAFIDSHI